MKKTRLVRTELIPKKLFDAIEALQLSRIQKSHVYRLIFNLEYHIQVDDEEADMYDYVDFPYNYIKKVFNSRYREWLKPCIDAGIIETKKYPSIDMETGELTFVEFKLPKIRNGKVTENGQSKSYRIKPELLLDVDNIVEVSFMEKWFLFPEYIKLNQKNYPTNLITDDILSLKIDEDRLTDLTYEMIIDFYERERSNGNLFINEEITENSFEVEDRTDIYSKKYRTNKTKSLLFAKTYGYALIQYKNRFYIDKLKWFVNQKQIDMGKNYMCSIKKLAAKNIYAWRNERNNRLDTNITSISKSLLKVILEDNDLVEIDLCNSQYAILAFIMENDSNFIPTTDANAFIEEAGKGSLYDYIKNALSLEGRDGDCVKIKLMGVWFSTHKNRATFRKQLKGLFPSVIKYIDDFKKEKCKIDNENGHKEFAVLLQKEESRIFIDNIYVQLKEKGLFAITKHDSVIVRRSEMEEARSIIETYCDSIGFKRRFRYGK